MKYIFAPKYDVEDWYTLMCELKSMSDSQH